MNSIKNKITVSLLLLLSLLAACAAPTPELPPSATSGTDEQASVVISFGGYEASRSDYKPFIEQFNAENPGVQVAFVPLDDVLTPNDGNNNERLARSRAIAERADTFAPGIWIEEVHRFNLAPLIDADATFSREDFYPMVQNVLNAGAIYNLPSTINVSVLAYNKSLFQQKGLALPTNTWSWSDLRDAAVALVQRDEQRVQRYGILLGSPVITPLLGELELLNPALRDADFELADLDAEYTVKAVEQVLSLVEAGAVYMPPASGFQLNELTERVATQAFGIWDASLIPALADSEFEIGYISLPEAPDPFYNVPSTYSMSAGTQHAPEAWRWLSFLSRQYIPSPGLGASAEVPARISTAERVEFWQDMHHSLREAIQTSLTRSSGSSESALQILALRLNEPLQAIINGEPAATALREARTQAEVQARAGAPTQNPAIEQQIVVATPVPDNAPRSSTTATIRFGAFTGEQQQLERVAQAFMQDQPELSIEFVNTSTAQQGFEQAAQTADCFAWPVVRDSALLTQVQNLRPLLDADSSLSLAAFPKGLVAQVEYQGALYGLPLGFNAPVLGFNSALFDQKQQAHPEAAWSINEIARVAGKLTAAGAGNQYGFAITASPTRNLAVYMAVRGRPLVSLLLADGRLDFTTPAVVTILHEYIDFLQQSVADPRLSDYRATSASAQPFISSLGDNAAMWFSETRPTVRGAGITSLPFENAEGLIATMSLNALYISANSSSANHCWTWMTYLSSHPDAVSELFPARVALITNNVFLEQVLPGTTSAYESYLKLLQQEPVPPQSLAAMDFFWFYRAVDRALQGGNLEQELVEAQFFTEQHLACVQGGGSPGNCARQVDSTYQGFSTR